LQVLLLRFYCTIRFATLSIFYYFCKRIVTTKIKTLKIRIITDSMYQTLNGSNVRVTLLERMHWAFNGVTFHFYRNLAVGYNLRKPSVTACCFRHKVLFDMYAIQRPATSKWLRTQQSCGSAVFSIALCDTCVMRCTSQTADFVANCNSLDLRSHPAETAFVLLIRHIFNIPFLIRSVYLIVTIIPEVLWYS